MHAFDITWVALTPNRSLALKIWDFLGNEIDRIQMATTSNDQKIRWKLARWQPEHGIVTQSEERPTRTGRRHQALSKRNIKLHFNSHCEGSPQDGKRRFRKSFKKKCVMYVSLSTELNVKLYVLAFHVCSITGKQSLQYMALLMSWGPSTDLIARRPCTLQDAELNAWQQKLVYSSSGIQCMSSMGDFWIRTPRFSTNFTSFWAICFRRKWFE